MRALLLPLALLALPGCLLGNIGADACVSDAECAAAFGLGSTCSAGYCSEPPACTTGHDCRRLAGFGACVEGACRAELPASDRCGAGNEFGMIEPEDVADKVGTSRLVGTMLSMSQASSQAVANAGRLAIREINRSGGDAQGAELGMIVCDNGGPMNSAMGDERKALIEGSLDYLAGTLGVPFILGPATSSDSITAINYLVEKQYPTVLISPSATSPALSATPDKLADSDPYGLFWRTVPSDELQAQVLATDVIGADPALLKVAVVHLQDTYGTGLASAFQMAFTAQVGKTVTLFPFDAATDMATLAGSVAADAPDAVLVIAIQATDATAFLGACVGTTLETKRFFLTDGSKEAPVLLDAALPAGVKAILQNTVGTGPASPAGPLYEQFRANLLKDFSLQADSFSFLAQAYDAVYVGSYATVWAGRAGTDFDGRGVAEGLATRLASGSPVDVGEASWPIGKGALVGDAPIDFTGTSGPLAFDPTLGQAPGPIEVWGISADGLSFTVQQVIDP